MATRDKAANLGAARARRILIDVGEELRRARKTHGLSQGRVGAAVGLSASSVSRIERALVGNLAIVDAARLLAVVGLELGARAYPGGAPIRDAAHRALLDRLRVRVARTLRWEYEVPLPIPGDLRAWDSTVGGATWRVGIEAEMRPRDLQEVQRRTALKVRDDERVGYVILLLADTRTNRQLIREHAETLRAGFPVPGEEALRALANGREPAGNAVLLL